MRPETRVKRWRDIAEIVQTRAAGDLAVALAALPLAKARALLKAFPTIGDPGADRIMLFAGLAPRPSLESMACGPWRGWASSVKGGTTLPPTAPPSTPWSATAR
jgi:hypothetical protein